MLNELLAAAMVLRAAEVVADLRREIPEYALSAEDRALIEAVDNLQRIQQTPRS